MAAGIATRFGIYDLTGYYDINLAGGEVQNPRRNIPISVVTTCFVVGLIYLLVYVGVIGTLDWRAYVANYSDDAEGIPVGIMSLVAEARCGKVVACIVTLVVCVTILGSNYAMVCGFSYLPYAAARDGDFFKILAHTSKKHDGLPDYSLLMVGLLTACWCFFSFGVVVDALVTLMVFVQFLGQSVGLLIFRYRNRHNLPEGWRMPLFPLPCILQVVIFGYILITSTFI